jgi:hypothetical protein
MNRCRRRRKIKQTLKIKEITREFYSFIRKN